MAEVTVTIRSFTWQTLPGASWGWEYGTHSSDCDGLDPVLREIKYHQVVTALSGQGCDREMRGLSEQGWDRNPRSQSGAWARSNIQARKTKSRRTWARGSHRCHRPEVITVKHGRSGQAESPSLQRKQADGKEGQPGD